jgi:hypothetical protein
MLLAVGDKQNGTTSILLIAKANNMPITVFWRPKTSSNIGISEANVLITCSVAEKESD